MPIFPQKRTRWLRRMAIASAILLYLAFTIYQLHLPGLHYDEAREAGVNALELWQQQDVQAFRAAGVRVGPWFLPFMVQDYIGALNVYLATPLLALFGASTPVLRLLGVGCGLLTLLAVWALGRELARWAQPARVGWAGEIAALLLAVNPTFVFWSRQGIFVTNIVVTLAVLSVLLALRWARSGHTLYFYSFALLAGLGLWSKLLFVWVLGALAGTGALVWVGQRRRHGAGTPPRVRPRAALLAALLFLLGLSPLLLFNLQTAGTIQSIFGNLGQSYYGVENAAFTANFAMRLRQLGTLLRGDHLWYLGESYANRWASFSAALLLVTATSAAFVRRRINSARWLALLGGAGLFVLLLVMQSSFTVSDLFVTHFAIVQPFVWVLVALAADSVLAASAASSLALRQAVSIAVLGTLLLWGSVDAAHTVRYHTALTRSGGLASHSDAIERLAQWLDARAVRQPIVLDWGIEAQVRFLTSNRVQPLEIFGYESLDAPDPAFTDRAGKFIDDPTRLYVLRMPAQTVFQGRGPALEALAAQHGLKLMIRDSIYDRSGQVQFVLLAAEKPAP